MKNFLIILLMMIFSGCGIYSFSGVNLGKAKTVSFSYFDNTAKIVNADFSNARLWNLDLRKTIIKNTNFSHAAIAISVLDGLDLRDSNLQDTILWKSSFKGSILNKRDCKHIKEQGVPDKVGNKSDGDACREVHFAGKREHSRRHQRDETTTEGV